MSRELLEVGLKTVKMKVFSEFTGGAAVSSL